jgi:stage V sporulation protein G
MIEVARLHRFDNGSSLKAFADVIIGEVLVKGIRVIDGREGLFVTMPKAQGKDGKWYPTVTLVDKSMQGELQSVVLEAYHA